MKSNTTFLTFVGKNFGKAEEAVRFYISLFEDAELKTIRYFEKGEVGGEEGAVKHASFRMGGQDYMAIDSNLAHGFNFSPAISIYVNCESGAEIDSLYQNLMEGGHAMMPIGYYGFSEKFAWVADRYGVSWQLNLGRLQFPVQ
jgi:predicted 3-demethylubiquinone-9 3-methyltransferase (glyoxalase superfamily)